jgi:adenosylhomocysteinase
MDMSFAAQALAVAHLARQEARVGPGVRLPPFELDHEVARLKLASLGIEIDVLSDAQERYLRSFR